MMMLVCLMAITASAQERKFNPAKFKADAKAFILKEVSMTPTESKAFFPVYFEMIDKKGEVFKRLGQMRKQQPKTDAEARKLITTHDQLSLRLQQIENDYHKKFLTVLPAKKVLLVMRADGKFRRQSLQKVAKNHK